MSSASDPAGNPAIGRSVEANGIRTDYLEAGSGDHRALIVQGREDAVIPLSTSSTLLTLIDRADLVVFSHCGHWTQIERKDDFNRLCRAFFLEA